MNKIFVSSKTLQNLIFDVISTHNVMMNLGHFIFRDKYLIDNTFSSWYLFFQKKRNHLCAQISLQIKAFLYRCTLYVQVEGKKIKQNHTKLVSLKV